MAQQVSAPTPRNRKLLLGVIVAMTAVVIVIAALAVVWYTVLDDAEILGISLTGDGESADETQSAQDDRSAGDDEPPPSASGDEGDEPSDNGAGEAPTPPPDVLITPPEVELIGIIPQPRIVTLNGEGQSQPLTVQGFYSDGSTIPLDEDPSAFSYTSSDASVAEVTAGGMITGLKAGGADIKVSYGDFVSKVPVLVWGEVRQIPPIDPDKVLEIDEDGTAIVLNRVMVELERGHGSEDVEELAGRIDGEVVFEYMSFPGYVVDFNASTDAELEAALNLLLSDSRVADAYPEMLMPVAQGPAPIESVVNTLAIGYQRFGYPKAWTLMNQVHLSGIDPIVVVVVDTDFQPYPSGDSILDTVIREEFGDIVFHTGASTPNYGAADVNVIDLVPGTVDPSHGTAVASIIVANNNTPVNQDGFSGVVGSVSDIPYELIFYSVGSKKYRIFDQVDTEATVTALNLINALDQVQPYQAQADVVNLSFGINCKRFGLDCFKSGEQNGNGWEWRMYRLIKEMDEITFVVAAGNKDDDIVNKRSIPAVFANYLDNVITVGGTDSYGNKKHSNSNYGNAVTIGAPYVLKAVDADSDSSGYKKFGGTSYAAPLVAGTVALLKALDSTLTPPEISDILPTTARNMALGQPTGQNWPVINAGAAVEEVLNIDAEFVWRTSTTLRKEGFAGIPVELLIPVKNTGSHTWPFEIRGKADSYNLSIEANPLKYFMAPGLTNQFRFSIIPPLSDALSVTLTLIDPINEDELDTLNLKVIVATPTLNLPVATLEAATHTSMPSSTPTHTPTSTASCQEERLPATLPNQRFGGIIRDVNFTSGYPSGGSLWVELNRLGRFFLEVRVLSHPGQFRQFNESHSATTQSAIPWNPSDVLVGRNTLFSMYTDGENYTPGGTASHDLEWKNFDYNCELAVAVFVRGLDGETLHDWATVRINMPPPIRTGFQPTPPPDPAVTAIPTPVAGGAACLPPAPMPSVQNPEYSKKTVEFKKFEKYGFSNATIKYIIANPTASLQTFYWDEKVISHPEMFSEINRIPMGEYDIEGGYGVSIATTLYPDGAQNNPQQETIQWKAFNHECPFEIQISVYADPERSHLLDRMLVVMDINEQGLAVDGAVHYSQKPVEP